MRLYDNEAARGFRFPAHATMGAVPKCDSGKSEKEGISRVEKKALQNGM